MRCSVLWIRVSAKCYPCKVMHYIYIYIHIFFITFHGYNFHLFSVSLLTHIFTCSEGESRNKRLLVYMDLSRASMFIQLLIGYQSSSSMTGFVVTNSWSVALPYNKQRHHYCCTSTQKLSSCCCSVIVEVFCFSTMSKAVLFGLWGGVVTAHPLQPFHKFETCSNIPRYVCFYMSFLDY